MRAQIPSAFCLGLVVAGCATPTRATLHYAAPTSHGCLRQATLERAVAERIGYNPWSSDAPQRINASVNQRGNRLIARFEVQDANHSARGVRELEGSVEECNELVHALALAISLAIDPLAFQQRDLQAEKETNREEVPAWTLSATAGATLGALPRASPNATVQLNRRFGWWSLGLEGQFLGMADASVANIRLATWRAGAMAQACGHYGLWELCPLIGTSVLGANGKGLIASGLRTHVVPAAGLRLGMQIPIFQSLRVVLRSDMVAPIARTVLEDNDAPNPFWKSPPVYGLFGIGLMYEIR